jgi:hypothetical protein
MYAMRTKKFMENNLLKIPFRRILKLTTLFSRTLEPAQPTNDCPHQYGMFRSGGGADGCSQFTNCVAGVGHAHSCPEGLAFNADNLDCRTTPLRLIQLLGSTPNNSTFDLFHP